VSVRLESLGKVRCVFAQEMRRDDEVLVKAKVTVACVTGENFKPTEIPEACAQEMEAPFDSQSRPHHRLDDRQREHRREGRDGDPGARLDALVDLHLHEDVRDPPRAPPADEFEREFWGGSDLVGLYQRAAAGATRPPAWSASSRRDSRSSSSSRDGRARTCRR
jgi:hypothetical protein